MGPARCSRNEQVAPTVARPSNVTNITHTSKKNLHRNESPRQRAWKRMSTAPAQHQCWPQHPLAHHVHHAVAAAASVHVRAWHAAVEGLLWEYAVPQPSDLHRESQAYACMGTPIA